MKKIVRKEFVIGLCVIIAGVVLFFGINFLKGINLFHTSNYYFASFTNVEGLAESAPVTLNGYKVGLVREIQYEYDNPGHVLVEMSLDRALKVPQGTKAVLSSDILGTATIKLEMAEHPDYHNVGDRLVGVNEPGLLDGISQSVMPAIDAIVPKVDTLLTSINALVSDPALAASVKRLDAITADLEKTTGNLAALSARLAPIAADVKVITGNVTEVTAGLTDVSAKLKAAPIDQLVGNLQATTTDLKELANQLNDPNSSLGLLMRDPALYNNINNTVGSLDSLLIDIKKNPKRYINIKVF